MQNQNTGNTQRSTVPTPKLEIVERTQDRPKVEMEIEKHIRQIRSLINKLHPVERQKYFDGFLTHLLNHQMRYPTTQLRNTNSTDVDLTAMSSGELELIRELSVKMEEMYRTIGDVE